MDASDKENCPAPFAMIDTPTMESKKNLFSDADMAEVDADIERLDAENAAMEAKLQLNRRTSFQAAGETEMGAKSCSMGLPSTPEVAAPPLPANSNPLVDLVHQFLGGFCVPCKAMAAKVA